MQVCTLVLQYSFCSGLIMTSRGLLPLVEDSMKRKGKGDVHYCEKGTKKLNSRPYITYKDAYFIPKSFVRLCSTYYVTLSIFFWTAFLAWQVSIFPMHCWHSYLVPLLVHLKNAREILLWTEMKLRHWMSHEVYSKFSSNVFFFKQVN